MTRYLLAAAVGLAAVAPLAAGTKTVHVQFGGPDGSPRLDPGATPAVANQALDDVAPFADANGMPGPAFKLPPGDVVELTVDDAVRRRAFRGKTMDVVIDSEEEERKKERAFLFFSKTVIKHHPKPEPRRDAPDLKLCEHIQLYLLVRPLGAAEPKRLPLTADRPVRYRLDQSSEVSVEMKVDPKSVAFADRKPNDDERQQIRQWENEIKAMPKRKKVGVKEPDKIVVKAGDVGQLTAVLTAKRE